MTNTYTLTTSPLVTQGSQLRWHIDSPSRKDPLTLTHGRIVLQGWLLAQGETSPRLAIKTGFATYSFLITHDPQPASRADMASEGLPRLHAPIQPTCS